MRPNQKNPDTEIEGMATRTIVSPTPKKKTFPWKIILILAIGGPAAAIGILASGFMLLYLILGPMDCGGSVPDQPSSSRPIKPVAPKPAIAK